MNGWIYIEKAFWTPRKSEERLLWYLQLSAQNIASDVVV